MIIQIFLNLGYKVKSAKKDHTFIIYVSCLNVVIVIWNDIFVIKYAKKI
jgi:hypothetical protein